MGFCSATEIFDGILDHFLAEDSENKEPIEVIKILIKTLWAMDWDCEGDSKYWEHPLIKQAFRELEAEEPD